MSTNVKKLDSNNFDSVFDSNVTLVDFWAEWCMPCRMQGPILDKVADKIGDKVLIGKVNVDDNQDLAVKYGVMSIPTLILFKEGKPIKQLVGVQNEETLTSIINSNI